MWTRVNFFGSMNWIGISAVYPGIQPKVKREGGQRFVFV